MLFNVSIYIITVNGWYSTVNKPLLNPKSETFWDVLLYLFNYYKHSLGG